MNHVCGNIAYLPIVTTWGTRACVRDIRERSYHGGMSLGGTQSGLYVKGYYGVEQPASMPESNLGHFSSARRRRRNTRRACALSVARRIAAGRGSFFYLCQNKSMQAISMCARQQSDRKQMRCTTQRPMASVEGRTAVVVCGGVCHHCLPSHVEEANQCPWFSRLMLLTPGVGHASCDNGRTTTLTTRTL